MSETTSGASGADQTSSGGTTETETTQTTGDSQSTDKVNFETHRKLLAEKKRVQAEAESLKKKLEEIEVKDAEQKGNLQKLLDIERDRAKKASEELETYRQREVSRKKIQAVLDVAKTRIESRWFNVIDLEQVVVDPSSGEIDKGSVEAYVQTLQKEWPEMFAKGGKSGVSHDAAKPPGALDYEGWKSSKNTKEMREKLPDLVKAELARLKGTH